MLIVEAKKGCQRQLLRIKMRVNWIYRKGEDTVDCDLCNSVAKEKAKKAIKSSNQETEN